MQRQRAGGKGPFTAKQIRPGDRYELFEGHPVYCAPTGRDGARGTVAGAEVIDTDPAVDGAGVDAGYAPEGDVLWAPDVAVGGIEDRPGWVKGQVPALALEYASRGQDEEMLQEKIRDILQRGTRYVWVVRLEGPRRVEVYERGKRKRVRTAGEKLEAPEVLRNVVPVEALYDRRAAHDHTLRNLLQRRGYADLEAVRGEGRAKGLRKGRSVGRLAALRESVVRVLEARGIEIPEALRRSIRSERRPEALEALLARAAVVESAAALAKRPR